METIINSKLVERNRRIASGLFLATFLVLAGSFIYFNYALFTQSGNSDYLLLAQALALPLIFVMTIISIRMTNDWNREPHPENALAEGLKSLSKKSIIFHYYHGSARHVLIAPQGVFAIVTRWHEGKFRVEGDKWKTEKSAISRFFGAMRMDGLGNPSEDAKEATAHLEKLLKTIAPNIEIQALVIFVSPKAELTIEEPSIPVLYADESREPSLNSYMRKLNEQQRPDKQAKVKLPLTDEQIEAFKKATVR
jgi:nuclease-like protein